MEGAFISNFENFRTKDYNLELIDFRKKKHHRYQGKKFDLTKCGKTGSIEHFSILPLTRLTFLFDDKVQKFIWKSINMEHIMKCIEPLFFTFSLC